MSISSAPTNALSFRNRRHHAGGKDLRGRLPLRRGALCATCGVESFARGRKPDGSEAVAINVRCLDGIDFNALKPTPVDGRSR
jgi:hypothetical protein